MTKMELKHPEGKKAVNMDADKYNILADTILTLLAGRIDLSHNDLLKGVKDEFSKKHVTFSGSVDWHFEWVKLDLEARGKIKRNISTQTKYSLNIE